MSPASGPLPWFAGIDLGGSRIKAVVVDTQGRMLEESTIPFQDADRRWAQLIVDWVQDLRARRGWPTGLGLCAPGLPSPDARCIIHMPGRLHGLEGLDWAQHLGFRGRVPVFNDAHAALLGEAWIGAARGLQNVMMLTLGTGVGGAALVDGRLLRGHLGRAGHLGHITLDWRAANDDVGTPGSLEMLIGTKTLGVRSEGRHGNTKDLVDAVLQGDPEALRVWNDSVDALAVGINSLINVLDPEAVILGGGIAQAGRTLFDRLEATLTRHEWRPMGHRVRLLPAALGDRAGAFGAARSAIGSEPLARSGSAH